MPTHGRDVHHTWSLSHLRGNRARPADRHLSGRTHGPAPLRGKQIHVNRVALHECESCGHLMPTRAGQAKVDRLVTRSIQLFLGLLP